MPSDCESLALLRLLKYLIVHSKSSAELNVLVLNVIHELKETKFCNGVKPALHIGWMVDQNNVCGIVWI